MAGKEIPKNERQALDQLQKACLSVDSLRDHEKLNAFKTDFLKSTQNFHKQSEAFRAGISKTPLSLLVLLWGELLSHDKMFGKRYLGMLNDLLDAQLLCLADENKTVTLEDLSLQDPSFLIDRIRCYQDWSLQKREDHVLLYRAFSEWISKETFGYVPVAIDPDRITSQRRLVPFETYIEILSRLDLREQILAKIFYLGGPRSLEEVVSLRIENIDFSNFIISCPDNVSFPCHLLEDIKRFIEGRQKGFLFMGRDGERISHSTPFRALKAVVTELKLDPEFTFKDFTRNI